MAEDPARNFTVALDGGELYAEQSSASPTTIFVHGFGGDLRDWDLLWPQFGGAVARLRYDLRGFGRSAQRDPEPFSHVDDLLTLIDAAGLDRVDLVGLSMGGAIAASFALDHPERVRRLVLVSPGLVGWEWSDEWRSAWRAIVAAARAGEIERARELWWQNSLFRSVRQSAGAPALRESIRRYSGAQWIRDTQRAATPDLDRLHTMQSPTLLLSGGEDVADFRLIAELIAAAIPDVERVDYPHHGHALQLEAPAEIGSRITAFLAGE